MTATIRDALPGLSEAQIDELERAMEIRLPKPYREFLTKYNGGTPDPERFTTRDGKAVSIVSKFLPVDNSQADNLIEEIEGITQAGQIPSNLIPVATTPADNRVVLSVSGSDSGKIYYWSWGEEPDEPTCSYRYMRLVADSFDQFLDDLHD